MACSGRGQDTEQLMQLHPEAAVLPLGHCHKPDFTSGGKYLQLLYFPLSASSHLGKPFNTPGERWGKVSHKAKLLCSGVPELLMLIDDICSVATTSLDREKFAGSG